MSLQEAKLNERPAIHEPIVISSDDEEDDLPTTSVPAHRYPSKPIPSPPPTAPGYAVSAGTQALLSERAQLEAARLARLKARTGTTEASISTAATYKLASKPPKRRRSRDPDDPFVSSASDSDDDTPLPKKAKASHPPSKSVHSDPSMSANIWEKDGGEMFWDGELRQTANMHVDKEKDTKPVFRLTEILGEVSYIPLFIFTHLTSLSNLSEIGAQIRHFIVVCHPTILDLFPPSTRTACHLGLTAGRRWCIKCAQRTSKLGQGDPFPP